MTRDDTTPPPSTLAPPRVYTDEDGLRIEGHVDPRLDEPYVLIRVGMMSGSPPIGGYALALSPDEAERVRCALWEFRRDVEAATRDQIQRRHNG